jgi:short-subunit dehydrogenase
LQQDSQEIRSSEIAVTVLCPGPINTEFVDVAAMGHTARRTRFFFGEPKDVARAGIHAPRLLWLPFGRRLMA